MDAEPPEVTVMAVVAMARVTDERVGRVLEMAADLPTLSMNEEPDDDVWELVGPGDETRTLRHRPRLQCSSFDALLAATAMNLGIALLPEHLCTPAFASGEIVRVLPEWHTGYGTIHAVFTTRKVMLPAVRAWIDFLVEQVPAKLAA